MRSATLSNILSVSDSYLKKILRKLVLADIIFSNPGKDGGFQLSRSIEDITLYDVYAALEGKECEIKTSDIGSRIFKSEKDFEKEENIVENEFAKANTAFLKELSKFALSNLVSKQYYTKGTINFESNKQTT